MDKTSAERPTVQHTPGPWTMRRVGPTKRGYVITGPGSTGCDVATLPLNLGTPDTQRGANARLIAAAPELLAALRPLADVTDDNRCTSCNTEIAPEGYCGCKPPHDHAAKSVHDAYDRRCRARAAIRAATEGA